ncbi:hypothetical protein DV737_g3207, partial [Chaetothyriales sp. CBS 132003]
MEKPVPRRLTAASSPKQKYLLLYNAVSLALWSIITLRAFLLIPILAAHDKLYTLFDALFPLLKWIQTLALLEILHALLGLVRASPVTTFMQVASRLVVVWGVLDRYPDIVSTKNVWGRPVPGERGGPYAFAGIVLAWGVTEIIRYSFFVYKEGIDSRAPSWLTWLRYNTFFVLYPVGISSECWLIYLALKPAQKENRGIDWIFKAILLIYVPGSYILYTYMMSQRRKVLKVFEYIRKALARVTKLEQERDILRGQIKKLDTSHDEEVKMLKQRDAEERRKNLIDFMNQVADLNRRNRGLQEENGRLLEQTEQKESNMKNMQQKQNSQATEIEALRNQLAEQVHHSKLAEDELSKAQRKWAEAQKAAKDFDAVLKQRDTAEKSLKTEADTLQTKLNDCQAQVEKSKKMLERVKGFVVQLDMTTETLADDFDAVWMLCLDFVYSVVDKNLSKEALEAGELDDVLSELAEKDSDHERFVRKVLLRPFADRETTNITTRASKVRDNVVSFVMSIIPSEQLESFETNLQSLVERIARKWTKFQKSKTHFRVSGQMNNQLQTNAEWKVLKLPIDMDNKFTDPLKNDLLEAVLFPQLFSVDQDADKSIRPAIVVVSSQLREAEEESRTIKARLATAARRNSVTGTRPRTRDRHPDAAQNAGGAMPGGFLGDN